MSNVICVSQLKKKKIARIIIEMLIKEKKSEDKVH